MAHGIESEESKRTSRKQYPTNGGGRSNSSSFFMASGNQRDLAFDRDNGPKQKPRSFCNGLHHGIWACRQSKQGSLG